MNLDEAVEVAKGLGLNYVAVDETNFEPTKLIYGYTERPTLGDGEWLLREPFSYFQYLGEYDGDVCYSNSLREVE